MALSCVWRSGDNKNNYTWVSEGFEVPRRFWSVLGWRINKLMEEEDLEDCEDWVTAREREREWRKKERKDVDAGGRWGHSPHLLRDVGHRAPAYELKGRTSLLLRGRCYHLNFVNSRLSIHFTVHMMMLPGFSCECLELGWAQPEDWKSLCNLNLVCLPWSNHLNAVSSSLDTVTSESLCLMAF